MAKYLLLKHYRGGRAPVNDVAMDQWTPEEFTAHVGYMNDLAKRLEGSGEYVDSQALSQEGMWVRFDGEGRPPVVDGPFAETKDLIAGWMIIDVDSQGRAFEVAGELSAAVCRRRQTAGGVAGGPALPRRPAPRRRVSAAPGLDEELVRALTPAVLAALVGRGADFASAEDAVQEALLSAHQSWPREAPRDAKGWLITAAWRRYLDAVRSDAARTGREQRGACEPEPGPTEQVDTTLGLFFRCAHPSLSPTSAVALTLRALGGLSTRQIARAFLVPDSTMAQRISRAKTTIAGVGLGAASDVVSVARVLYLMFTEGYVGDLDLAAEAIRLARQIAGLTDEPEVAGLLALFLLHHARRDARTRADATLVPLAEQDRSRWHTDLITEGVDILQRALAAHRLGQYQAQAAIAALHADALSVQETDWVQITEWYDELVTLTDSPVHWLNRAVAVGEADGPEAGLAALDGLAPTLPRYAAVCAHLHERAGDLERAVALYRDAAAAATRVAERDHLTLLAARVHQDLTSRRGVTDGT